MRLFYEIYNPETGENQGLAEDMDGYLGEYVETAIEGAPPVREMPTPEKRPAGTTEKGNSPNV